MLNEIYRYIDLGHAWFQVIVILIISVVTILSGIRIVGAMIKNIVPIILFIFVVFFFIPQALDVVRVIIRTKTGFTF
jgi:Na+/alanine symporter